MKRSGIVVILLVVGIFTSCGTDVLEYDEMREMVWYGKGWKMPPKG